MKKTFYILIMCMVVGMISLPSCEQSVADEYPIMESYYTESLNLASVCVDSVKSFTSKLDGYVAQYPQAKNHKRYSLILENIKAASLRLNITINDEWDGDTVIHF